MHQSTIVFVFFIDNLITCEFASLTIGIWEWLSTLLAAAGEPDIREKLKKGHRVGKKKFKVHLDGYNLLPYLIGQVKKSPREEFLLVFQPIK